MKTIRHTVNVPDQMEQLLNERIQDFRSLSGYFVSLGIQSNPDSGLARITPFIPPLAPMTMSARVLLGHAEPWELPASIAVMLVATYGLVRLAGSAYAGNILRFGGRVTLRGVLRP